jgi:nitrogen-specific signal transduction histidine kinase/ActR/RegA family two-component response regulator
MTRDPTSTPFPGSPAGARDEAFRRQAEEERLAIMKCAQESARLESMGLLAGGVAHDFNNLLTGILGGVELAMEEVADRPNAVALLENALNAGRRARDLCAQVLNHVRRSERIDETVDLHLLVNDAASLMSTSTKEVNFHLQLHAVPSITNGSVGEIRQILLNLLINATEAMGKDGGNIWIDTNHVHVKNRVERKVQPGDYIELRVRDDGHGMTPEIKARIFDAFYTTKPSGTGIGLSSVGRIMAGHGGSVTVESEVGVGTTFTLLFPLADAVKTTGRKAPGWQAKGRVLVVDDEELLAESIAMVLRSHGLTVDVAIGGEAALKTFHEAEEAYVAVMQDLTMPDMDGADTLLALRKAGLTAPVILMSGLERNPALIRIPRSEYSTFLLKPFASKGIIAAVRGVLEPTSMDFREPALAEE